MEKVEYKMETEFAAPPAWMCAPHVGKPWDWMAVAEKATVRALRGV